MGLERKMFDSLEFRAFWCGKREKGVFFFTFFFLENFRANSLLYGGHNGSPLGLF